MALDDPLINRKLGDYTIISLLGRGGMSRVYRGFDENLQRYAAVKVISGDFATTTEEEYTRRFTSEARAIARLRHPNIVGVYQFGRTEGIYYMAQVFLEGHDLRALLKNYSEQNRRIPFEEVLRIVRDVASALDYAHSQGVIHRDIKPSNIMLEKTTGRAILMDFGLAMSVQEGTMGDTFGSAHYIAPEQAISSAKALPQSDQYSLGIVIYEMLAGKVPFDDPSVMSVALKHLNEVPPPPTMYNPDLPAAVEAVILKALSKDPAWRHPDVTALADALEEAFSESVGQDAAVRWSELSTPDSRPTPGVKPAGLSQVPAEGQEDEPREGGIIGRFARRRAQREQDVMLSRPADEGTVPLDNQSLDTLLQSMERPMEPADTQGQYRVSESLFDRPMVERHDSPKVDRSRRPSRKGAWLKWLVALLVIGMVGAAAWFGLGLGDQKDEPGSVSITGSATALAANRSTGTQSANLSAALQTASAEPVSTQSTTTPQQAGLAGETAEASSEARQSTAARPTVTMAVSPSAEMTAGAIRALTQTPTQIVATASPTAQVSQTASPPAGQSQLTPPISTDSPIATPTEVAVASAATMNVGANFRLIYDAESFVLVNVSGRQQDASTLIFERRLPDGTVISFDADSWDRPYIEGKPDAMIADGCFQLITTAATQVTPDLSDCPLFLGYFRSNSPRNYFWLSTDEDAAFTVRQAGRTEPFATCSIAAGQCVVDTRMEAVEGVEMPGVAADVTPVGQTGTPTIRLDYDDEHFILINISSETQDVSRLHFVLDLPGVPPRSFLSVEWDDAGIGGDTSALRAGGCLELIASEADVITPDPEACPSFLGWFRSNLDERYFWIVDRPRAMFEVRVANEGTLLAKCLIDNGQCEFNIP